MGGFAKMGWRSKSAQLQELINPGGSVQWDSGRGLTAHTHTERERERAVNMSLLPLVRSFLTAKRGPLPAIQAFRRNTGGRPAAERAAGGLKTAEDLPGTGLLSNFYWHFIRGYYEKTHELQIVQKKMFGPIWKNKFGPITVINVATADLIEQVLRQEGKYPVRAHMPHWREYRELRGQAYGPLCEYGEKWHQLRSMLNPKMLKPKEVSNYSPAINEVVTDFVKKVKWLRENQGGGVMLNDVSSELYKFAFEAEKLVNKKIREIEEHVEKGCAVEGEYLTYLLANIKMTPFDVYGSLCELLLAAVDTTSNTTSWILYNLAREPSIQQQLYEEVTSVCPGDQIPEAKDFANMPFLKAVAKETLRMYPVVPGNARLAIEKGVVAGGYYFPKNTLFHLCHYAVSQEDSEFTESRSFQPNRWLRTNKEEKNQHHPFASIPFGFGTRTCLGKRVAELEMYSVISQLIKHFEVRPDPSGKVVMAKTRTLLCPGSPINLQFIDRK
ncbi:sterol 26-hydroxylase, mitochondrial isoform X2 [Hemiscyllium ocellatum]|uniref:sterol 26-hydroxylase, mitochondrial isoform X2 n=1 Tax=Hemiscyllium ocellatum TaxID=170820 RepID=UPI002966509B|nr:sterol 26-hydroxylase, mitochondrial isoform X2 [Hemiscyllium ocellatum]